MHQAHSAAPKQVEAAGRCVVDVATQCSLFQLLLQLHDVAGCTLAHVVIPEVYQEAAHGVEHIFRVRITAGRQTGRRVPGVSYHHNTIVKHRGRCVAELKVLHDCVNTIADCWCSKSTSNVSKLPEATHVSAEAYILQVCTGGTT